ncbi:MAG: sulfate ABC transporter permease subunit CysT [Verrucomicrobiota bacterium]
MATSQTGVKKFSVLPGFKLTLGFTLFYLGLIVLIPLAATFGKTASLSWAQFWHAVASPAALAAYRLSFGVSLLAAMVNAVFGLIVAWVLVRYQFWGRRLVDALVDLPFALPTAVAGITLAALYSENGWIGYFFASWNPRQSLIYHSHHLISELLKVSWLHSFIDFSISVFRPVWHWFVVHTPNSSLHIQISYTWLGVFVALTFIGLPFIVRTLQPVLEDLDLEVEEAAASLGANRFKTFFRVILPMIFPALLTGFALAFARALGEYGSVVFISSNIPLKSQIVPVLIMSKLEQFDYAGATALAVVMLVVSFLLLLAINLLQWWSTQHRERI